uniref:Uncharacterized protein n=1 Tax=Lepeophtheirus salmonis TaxID=72036 RepID=A0A0K2U286_LEPSM
MRLLNKTTLRYFLCESTLVINQVVWKLRWGSPILSISLQNK